MDDWISVEKKLPDEDQFVLIYAGNYVQDQKYAVARFEKGISQKEREDMKNGVLDFEMVNGISYNGDDPKPIYSSAERWKVYTSSDEHGNNHKPYSWADLPMRYFGQYVTHWQNLPDIPIKND